MIFSILYNSFFKGHACFSGCIERLYKIFSTLLFLQLIKNTRINFVSVSSRSIIIMQSIGEEGERNNYGMIMGNQNACRGSIETNIRAEDITLTILDSMSRLWSRLLLPRTGVQRNISMELPSLLRLSKLLTATIAAASYNSLKAFGLVSDVNNAVDGLLTM